ncbi:tetraacyldisaccharide 4'-kinase [Bacterioplanes sanyensis]|uniref:Tetraacyldisaccharide 4'-kinase n=1 Tax=Bacterioplanes sanyensis TaxID=1249553 RepID=A0A222FG02_9GAMM|nr:M3 family metallopeptidase [Bacterioplanes sanyensis]ASP37424.1 tetraacyldisaccharide 4'-kinase [Bacterioplanes sanyensis]
MKYFRTAVLTATLLSAHSVGASELLIDGMNATASAKDWQTLCEQQLSKAREHFTAVEQGTGPANVETVLQQYEQVNYALQPLMPASYIKAVHPDKAVRDSAEACIQKIADFDSSIYLSQPFYQRLSAVDDTNLKADTRFFLHRLLRDLRRSGVDRDEETRNKIFALQQQITELGNEFGRNIQEDVRTLEVGIDDLAGLPEDYIAERVKTGEKTVTLTTNYPDLYPVLTYAHSDKLRYDLRVLAMQRGYPANAKVLKELISRRHEMAKILGYNSFAEYNMETEMIGSPEKANAFLQRINTALKDSVEQESQRALARLQKIDPTAKIVNQWQASYIDNLIRQEEYALDAKEVRQYFQYANVRDGVLKLSESLFGIEIRPWKTEVWHEDVEAYEILEDGKLIGRFYMDNHPRDGKYQHAAYWGLRNGIKGKQIPLAALAQNFPKGLMEHGQVETFLHEFGHLLHSIFAGQHQRWLDNSGLAMEWDFVEAPSQMLEEWVWDYGTLKTFAQNQQGEVIPKELFMKMNKARDYGKATGTAVQLFYAQLSLQYYMNDPAGFELQPMMVKLQQQYSPYPYMEGTHFYANFGHLDGYSSNYYTYQWSLAIATDLFSRFEKEGLNNREIAQAYRDKILAAGGSKPAAEMVEDFLGRPFNEDAYINNLKSL